MAKKPPPFRFSPQTRTSTRKTKKQKNEQYNLGFYLTYLARWPELCLSAVEEEEEGSEEEEEEEETEREERPEGPSNAAAAAKKTGKGESKRSKPTSGGAVLGYILGKVEGKGDSWHGHITALAVAPAARRSGLAKALTRELERRAEAAGGRFVDLFVRASNERAIKLYEGLGYVTYRRVLGYYSGGGGSGGGKGGGKGGAGGGEEPPESEDALDMRKSLPADGPEKKSMRPLGRAIKPHELEFD